MKAWCKRTAATALQYDPLKCIFYSRSIETKPSISKITLETKHFFFFKPRIWLIKAQVLFGMRLHRITAVIHFLLALSWLFYKDFVMSQCTPGHPLAVPDSTSWPQPFPGDEREDAAERTAPMPGSGHEEAPGRALGTSSWEKWLRSPIWP